MEIVIVGTGYVGLVTGTCLAEMGNSVTCVDVDRAKIDALQQGVIPIYEPGLQPMVRKNVEEGRLHFTTSLSKAMATANIYFIAVGTPPRPDGSANLDFVVDVTRQIGRHLTRYSVIVDKSTVPVGTADQVRMIIKQELSRRQQDVPFDVVSNPEFLKEGAAIEDFMRPDRIIVGTESERAVELMAKLYAPFNQRNDRLIVMGTRDAEMAKYAANAMLATKISFMNEIANLCDKMAVDVENVRHGIGSDSRIGYSFIYPGCGYGGSCFPKDVRALVHMSEVHGIEPKILNAVQARNEDQKRVLFEKITRRFGQNLDDVAIGIWGLSFKPGTDDMREASSIELIGALVKAGARVNVYDPIAMDVARDQLASQTSGRGTIEFAENQYDALRDVDGLALVTEWNPFRNPDFHLMRKIMRQLVIFDGRNIYDPNMLADFDFEYLGIGRECHNVKLVRQLSLNACA